MSSNLTPNDNNYLTNRIRYDQLIQGAENFEVNTNNYTVNVQPTVKTFGDGVAQMSGSVVVAGTPAADYLIGSLPSWCVPVEDSPYPVSVLRAGAYVANAVTVNRSGNTIESITVTAPGSYATIPTVAIVGSGTGASVLPTMKAISATVTTAGTTYAPGDIITATGGTSTSAVQFTVSNTEVISLALNAAGTNYVPGETLTLVGGTQTTAPTATVASTKVVSATITSPGSGGTDGTQTVTGTTGTGTKFQAIVTIASGAITSVNSITTGGAYTVNPTLLTAEPVTGASLTGATLNVVLGVNLVTLVNAGVFTANAASFTSTASGSGAGATFNTIVYGVNEVSIGTTAGDYSVLPSNPVAQGSTTGTGTGATFTILWGLKGITVSNGGTGYDNNTTVSITGGGSTGGGAASVALDSTTGLSLVNAPTVGDVVYLGSVSFIVDSY
jgi:hypothetical protein